MQSLAGQNNEGFDRYGRQESGDAFGIVETRNFGRRMDRGWPQPMCGEAFGCLLEQETQRIRCRRILRSKCIKNQERCVSQFPNAPQKCGGPDSGNRVCLSFGGKSCELEPVPDIPRRVQQIIVAGRHVPGEDGVGEIDRRIATYEVLRRPDGR